VKREIVDRSAPNWDLARFLVCAGVGGVVSSSLAIALRGGLFWSAVTVLFCACGGGLIGAAWVQERSG
jgi:Na+(H+)/acetate symporter ActP